jgi:hypothetical protein
MGTTTDTNCAIPSARVRELEGGNDEELVALLVAGAFIIGGVSWASIPAPDGSIDACYRVSGNPMLVELFELSTHR